MVVGSILFLAYSGFCFWAIFMHGADVLDQYIISSRTGQPFTPGKLKIYVGITWLIGLGLMLLQFFFGPKT